MSEAFQNLDELVDRLSHQRVRKPLMRLSLAFPILMGLIILPAAAFVMVQGIRDEMSSMLILESLFFAGLGILNFLAAVHLRLPDGGGRLWMRHIPVVTLAGSLLFFVFSFISLNQVHIHGPEVIGHMHSHCTYETIAMLVVPVVMAVYACRRGASVYRVRCALAISVGAAALSWLVLRGVCPYDEGAHLFLSHFVPAVLAGFMSTMIATRVLKW